MTAPRIDIWTLCARLVLMRNCTAAKVAVALNIGIIEAMDRLTATLAVREW